MEPLSSPASPISASPAHVTPVPKDRHPIHWILVLLVFLSLGLSAFLLYQGRELNQQLTELNEAYKTQPQPAASPANSSSDLSSEALREGGSPAPSEVPSDWKTYTNQKNSYSLKYPSKWLISDSNSEKSLSLGPSLEGTKVYSIQISPINNSSKYSSIEYVAQLIKENQELTNQQQTNKLIYEALIELNIDNLPAVELKKVFGMDQRSDIFFVANGNKIIKISMPSEEENPNLLNPVDNHKISQQILSTFQFTK